MVTFTTMIFNSACLGGQLLPSQTGTFYMINVKLKDVNTVGNKKKKKYNTFIGLHTSVDMVTVDCRTVTVWYTV